MRGPLSSYVGEAMALLSCTSFEFDENSVVEGCVGWIEGVLDSAQKMLIFGCGEIEVTDRFSQRGKDKSF